MRLNLSLPLRAFVLVLLLATGHRGQASFCNRNVNETSPMNNHSIDVSEPVFLRSVPNGELYVVGNAENRLHILHLYGYNGYDFGYAAGQLIGNEIREILGGAWQYFERRILEKVNNSGIPSKYNLPPWLVDLISDVGLEAALDLQNVESAPFVDPEIYAEMHGMADAAGIDYNQIVRIHLIGEITRGQCSLYGAYGNATLGGKTLQLRALDWDLGAGLQNFPTVTIYHPLAPAVVGFAFANVGWAGWIGTLTGMSSNRLGISEIGIAFPDSTFGDESFIGIPFVFLERKILQWATSVHDAMDMILNANRTCRLVLGVADGNAKTARMVEYSHSKATIFNASDLQPLEWWHPRLDDTVYCGMDWVCPYYQYLLYTQLNALHGRLTPENTASNVTAVVGTGDLHIGIYDLTDNVLFVANARGANQTGLPHAYQRQFLRLNMTSHFTKIYGDRR